MFTSRMLTVSLKYKLNSSDNMKLHSEQLKNKLNDLISSNEFDTCLNLITKEKTINIEQCDGQNVEYIVTLFGSFKRSEEKPSKLMRAYIESHLTKIVVEDPFVARLIKRRVY